jgi:hypothetical protein
MGAHFYYYIVPFDPDIQAALDRLREREFNAGRYNPVMPFIDFPITPASPAPGPQHDSPEDALVDADADGTRSILDIASISDFPDFGAAAPLSEDILDSLYGTIQPTRQQVEPEMAFAEDLERGEAVYIVLHANGQPSELLFAGYSFD